MSIEYTARSIFDIEAEAWVNPVNCLGAAGKGLALKFKQKFPENYREYYFAAKNREIRIGNIFVVQPDLRPPPSPKYILNFPTKADWRERSHLTYISRGLVDLIEKVEILKIRSIVIPPLGCGLGRLCWDNVDSLIRAAFLDFLEVRVVICEPR